MVELVRLHKGAVYGQRNGVLIPVITDGLVAYYPMTEGSGTTLYDESKTGNTGTINGATWAWTPENIGRALDFDGSGDYVDCGTGINPTTEVTASFWLKPRNLSAWQGIIREHGYDFAFRISPSINGIYVAIYDVNGNSAVINFGDMSDKAWHHVTVTADTTEDSVKCYMDGDLKKAGSGGYTGDLAVKDTNTLKLGYPIGTNYFNGSLDSVRIYNRALSAEEINNIYQKTRGFYGV